MDLKTLIHDQIFTKNYYLARIGYSCWFYIKSLGKQPLLVYQMGKVGSKTVHASLAACHLNLPIYHCHFLSSRAVMISENIHYEKRIGINRKLKNKFPPHLFVSYFIRSYLILRNRSEGKKWKIITLIRDPIARNISAFFQVAYRLVPGFHKGLNTITHEKLYQAFLDNIDHEFPLTWFDLELYSFFKIDVYSSQFPSEKGYKIYSSEQAEMLLIRLENLSDVFSNAISEFLGVGNINLVPKNEAKDKEYSSLYRRFLNEVCLPNGYIEKMYSSRFANHFYTKEEIREFTSRWGK